MQVNIDADIIIYRAAAASENDSLDVACLRADDMMRRILVNCETDTYRAFISGGTNFRYAVDPLYKANRKDKVDPRWREDLKEFLITEWEAEVTDGIEADDMLGICQTGSTVLASIDKDLKQVSGKHYNFVKNEFSSVEPLDGLRFFYKQLLIGDTSDNIFGVKGIGPVKASKLLDHIKEEEEMYFYVRRLYENDVERLHRNAKLLWIMKKENDYWQPSPNLLAYYNQQEQEVVAQLKTLEAQTEISLENTGLVTSG